MRGTLQGLERLVTKLSPRRDFVTVVAAPTFHSGFLDRRSCPFRREEDDDDSALSKRFGEPLPGQDQQVGGHTSAKLSADSIRCSPWDGPTVVVTVMPVVFSNWGKSLWQAG